MRRGAIGEWLLAASNVAHTPCFTELPMKFALNTGSAANLVKGYSATQVRVGEKVITHSFLLSATDIIEEWPPQKLDELRVEDLEPVFALKPEVVLLGSGERQRFPPTEVISAVLSRGIGFEVMDTGAACRTFNILVSEDRRVVAALFLGQ